MTGGEIYECKANADGGLVTLKKPGITTQVTITFNNNAQYYTQGGEDVLQEPQYVVADSMCQLNANEFDQLNAYYSKFKGWNTRRDGKGTSYTNYASLRDYNSGELTYGDERSPQNQLYKKFETSPTTKSFTSVGFTSFNANIETSNKSSVQAGYCPEGYRVPSQIEMTMMQLYGAGVGSTQHTRTYWSLGNIALPTGYKQNNDGFTLLSNGNMTVGGGNATTVRCVRDIRVE